MTDVEYSPAVCQTILNEIISLLSLFEENMSISSRLDDILSQHLSGNAGLNNFLSTCCYGRTGVSVSLHDFNSICILPRTDWRCRLVLKDPSCPELLSVSPSLLEKEDRDQHIVQKFTYTKNTLLLVLQDVIHVHPRKTFIRLYLPPELPIAWSLAILGLKNQASNFIPPSVHIIRERLTVSIDKAILKKERISRFRLFCKESGSFWLLDDDGVGIQQVYLSACSDFPNILQEHLLEKNSTLDKLAGVFPSRHHPEVEAIVRDAFSRAELKGLESKDMLLADGSLGGTVFAMHNSGFVSVEWLAAYLVDTDNNYFMTDVRALAMNGKERLLRIFSTNHTYNDPHCLHFGEKKSGTSISCLLYTLDDADET